MLVHQGMEYAAVPGSVPPLRGGAKLLGDDPWYLISPTSFAVGNLKGNAVKWRNVGFSSEPPARVSFMCWLGQIEEREFVFVFGGQVIDEVPPSIFKDEGGGKASGSKKKKEDEGPKLRLQPSAISLSADKLLLFGGQVGDVGCADEKLADDMWTLDVKNERWNQVKYAGYYPGARRDAFFVRASGSELILIGGHCDTLDPNLPPTAEIASPTHGGGAGGEAALSLAQSQAVCKQRLDLRAQIEELQPTPEAQEETETAYAQIDQFRQNIRRQEDVEAEVLSWISEETRWRRNFGFLNRRLKNLVAAAEAKLFSEQVLEYVESGDSGEAIADHRIGELENDAEKCYGTHAQELAEVRNLLRQPEFQELLQAKGRSGTRKVKIDKLIAAFSGGSGGGSAAGSVAEGAAGGSVGESPARRPLCTAARKQLQAATKDFVRAAQLQLQHSGPCRSNGPAVRANTDWQDFADALLEEKIDPLSSKDGITKLQQLCRILAFEANLRSFAFWPLLSESIAHVYDPELADKAGKNGSAELDGAEAANEDDVFDSEATFTARALPLEDVLVFCECYAAVGHQCRHAFTALVKQSLHRLRADLPLVTAEPRRGKTADATGTKQDALAVFETEQATTENAAPTADSAVQSEPVVSLEPLVDWMGRRILPLAEIAQLPTRLQRREAERERAKQLEELDDLAKTERLFTRVLACFGNSCILNNRLFTELSEHLMTWRDPWPFHRQRFVLLLVHVMGKVGYRNDALLAHLGKKYWNMSEDVGGGSGDVSSGHAADPLIGVAGAAFGSTLPDNAARTRDASVGFCLQTATGAEEKTC
eukprot:g9945.t1